MTLICILIFLTTALTLTTEAYKILLVFPIESPSHSILSNAYVKHLLSAGHEVTYITPYPRKDSHEKLHHIFVEYPEELSLTKSMFRIDKILNNEVDPKDMSVLFSLVYDIFQYFLKHEDVQNLMNDEKQTFDIIILEWLLVEVNAGFAWFSTFDPNWMILRLVDEPTNPAYVPDTMSNIAPPFTFTQRVEQLWGQIQMTVISKFMDSTYGKLYDEIFVPAGEKRGIAVPPLGEVMYNASFVLSNSHVSFGEPIRLPQNFVPIGGYHKDQNPTPLPQDLQQIMDNAENGVIYFSMGSNLKSKYMPEKLKRELLEMFSELKQTVIWKFEETLSDLPKNVHILKWAPQQSILAHSKCLFFISHGGILSTIEALHFGVPIIGIPVLGDQFINVNRAVAKGFAIKVDLSYDTPKRLKTAIIEMLSNPSYHEIVKYLSLVYHDRPVPPAKELVHWVEHVAKTKGAPHLRSRALMTPWYQKMYLDLGVLILIIAMCFYSLVKVLFCPKQKINYRKKYE